MAGHAGECDPPLRALEIGACVEELSGRGDRHPSNGWEVHLDLWRGTRVERGSDGDVFWVEVPHVPTVGLGRTTVRFADTTLARFTDVVAALGGVGVGTRVGGRGIRFVRVPVGHLAWDVCPVRGVAKDIGLGVREDVSPWSDVGPGDVFADVGGSVERDVHPRVAIDVRDAVRAARLCELLGGEAEPAAAVASDRALFVGDALLGALDLDAAVGECE